MDPESSSETPVQTWYASPVERALEHYSVDSNQGLSSAEAAARLETHGPNILATHKGKGPILRFLLQFHQPLVYLLLAAGAITLALSEYIDSCVIFGVVLVNAFVGFIQEGRALRAIDALARTVTTQATVVRDGETKELPAEKLVPGDIVLLSSGQKAPADLRLIHARDLEIDESTLTGESVPVMKHIGEVDEKTVLGDRVNCAYASTLVTHGQGRGVIVATGDHTEVGRISELLESAETLETPLTRRISKFSQSLLYIILGLAVVTFVVGILRGMETAEIFVASVALAVGAIPEGLPAALTIILAIGVGRMAKRRAIVRRLPAVETLGGATVICSDKTGTLTENQMTVRTLYADGESWDVGGTGYAPTGEITGREERSRLDELLRCGLLCNDSRVEEEESDWRVEGDPTEGAMIVAARKGGLKVHEAQELYPRLDAIPFESEHRFMATLHSSPERRRIVYLKGATEALVPRCRDVDQDELIRIAEELASKGMRVLAFAKLLLEDPVDRIGFEDVEDGLEFLGFEAMIDPARPAAAGAVKACREAGIEVKMITGDHPRTARAIARDLNLCDVGAVSGQELNELSEKEFAEVANRSTIFARVSPEQKLRLVEAMQGAGHVVAMTGDGVNDAPALKRADIGIAMGGRGTDVAREASAMILTDDNFESIHAAVEEGRAVFENLKKFIVWTLPTNLGEGLILLAAIFAGITLPILPAQILWINMTTVAILGSALAFEPRETGVMKHPPRDPQEPILTRLLIFRIVFVAVLMLGGAFGVFEWLLHSGASVDSARTAAVNVVVAIELVYLLNCRSLIKPVWQVGVLSNRWILPAIAVMAILQWLFTYAPAMNLFFHSAPIAPEVWLMIGGITATVFVLVEIEKTILRLLKRE